MCETTPKYHAVEVARKRAQLTGAFGFCSATPSRVFSRCAYEYKLFKLTKRAKEASPQGMDC